ncbi:MAG: hypothetical protein WC980_04700 [Candidatus Brocadiia bacterium]
MLLPYLNKTEMKAIDKLKSFHGGAKAIDKAIQDKRRYQYRAKVAGQKGFSQVLSEAEGLANKFPKVAQYIVENNVRASKKGTATTQVSAWQGYKVTFEAMKYLAKRGDTLLPLEMISVMPLNDDYVYGGDLITTLAMCENIMGGHFCASSFLSTPIAAKHFDNIHKATGVKIATADAGNGLKVPVINNMGTVFGNICGVEVGNDNHLVYLDSITRTGLETGASFFLNPSWSTIVAACYYGRDIKNFTFKVSMFLSAQNLIQFRMLLNIIKTYLRKDKTSPIREINIGNAVSPEKFIECHQILKSAGIKNLSLTAHIRINTDLGRPDFNWFDNAVKVLDSGHDMTIKYESDGECAPDDTIATYFLSRADREAKAGILGEVLARKVMRCDKDAKAIMNLGHPALFAGLSQLDSYWFTERRK